MPGLADLMFQSNGTINPQYTAFRNAKQQQQSARNATRGQYDALLANFMQNFGGKRGDAKNAFQAQYGKFSDGTNNFLSRAPGYMNAFNNAQGLKSGLMSLLPQMPPSAPMQTNPGSLAMGVPMNAQDVMARVIPNLGTMNPRLGMTASPPPPPMTPGPMTVGGRQFTVPQPIY